MMTVPVSAPAWQYFSQEGGDGASEYRLWVPHGNLFLNAIPSPRKGLLTIVCPFQS